MQEKQKYFYKSDQKFLIKDKKEHFVRPFASRFVQNVAYFNRPEKGYFQRPEQKYAPKPVLNVKDHFRSFHEGSVNGENSDSQKIMRAVDKISQIVTEMHLRPLPNLGNINSAQNQLSSLEHSEVDEEYKSALGNNFFSNIMEASNEDASDNNYGRSRKGIL
jgi:hypothetical protein